ncbi:hypothetical protein OESDEN_20567 [Oesophagostomum dentatum]|uniref:Uncharacterized protein n=1 Tax=Oesophagostomum dentatum TaxID=61180 RepID=A0A0B1S7A1_OESDE|nr:hypothetical protein OESDEN_20567 [Oesophagostomum dentatum]
MRSILVVLCFAALVSPWVIYRRNQKKRLICKEEPLGANGTLLEDSAEEQPMVTSQRVRRDVEIDPHHKLPIIRLGVGLHIRISDIFK